MAQILLVDNEASILSVLTTLLKAEGHDVTPMRDPQKGADLIRTQKFDLLILDIRMTPVDGMDLLKLAREEQPTVPVIMFTAYGTMETAIEALKLGAFDYLTKPFKVDELLIQIQRALDYSRAINDNADLRAQLDARTRFDNIVAESSVMRNLCDMIARVAATDATVLIVGESGTGKELVARAVHAHSRRARKRFVAVNCAALPEPLLESEMFGHVKGAFTGAMAAKEGLFESADSGTIFLDEIGSMPLGIQGKLLRVLQEKEIRRVGGNETVPVNARVLTATNTRLEDLIAQNRFREDLYYRLSVIPIEIPPLRDRRDDIFPLIRHFLKGEQVGNEPLPEMASDVRDLLERYDWPGNVRELENAIKHALTFARDNRITMDVLPPRIIEAVGPAATTVVTLPGTPLTGPIVPLKDFLREHEKAYLRMILQSCGGDKHRAATMLKISLPTLYRKLPEVLGDLPAAPEAHAAEPTPSS